MKAKKILVMAAFIAAALSMGACSKNNTVTTTESKLPAEAQSTIDRYYKDLYISQIEIDKDHGVNEYNVMLSNGTELEFDQNGTIKEVIAGINDTVPRAFVPSEIIKYVTDNFPNQKIIQIDFGKLDTEVTLSTGIELQFDRNFNFKKIDR